MTLVNVNRFHCTNGTSTTSHHPHHHHGAFHHHSTALQYKQQQHPQQHQQAEYQRIEKINNFSIKNNKNQSSMHNPAHNACVHHHSHSPPLPLPSSITPADNAPCSNKRRQSSTYDNSSDISSFSSSSSATLSSSSSTSVSGASQNFCFDTKSRLIRLKRSSHSNNNNDSSPPQCSKSSSLGFSIRGGWEHGIGFFVSHVQAGSLAEQRGLAVGDEILQINGFPLERVIHDEVIALIRMSPNDLTLRVRSIGLVPYKDCSDQLSWKSAANSSHLMILDGVDSSVQQQMQPHHSDPYLQQQIYQESQVMIVCKEQSLGCSVVKGPTSLPGIFVQSVKHGRIASTAGLEVGDEIVKVNNTEVATIGFDGAIGMLKSLQSFTLIVRKGVAKHLFVPSTSLALLPLPADASSSAALSSSSPSSVATTALSSSLCTKRFTTTIVEQQQQQQLQSQQPQSTTAASSASSEILSQHQHHHHHHHLHQQTTLTTAKMLTTTNCCCGVNGGVGGGGAVVGSAPMLRQSGESEILVKATNAMENSLRLLQQVCEKEEKLALAEQKLNEEQQKLRQQQANLQISVLNSGATLDASGGAAITADQQLHHHRMLPAPPMPPMMPMTPMFVESSKTTASSSSPSSGTANGGMTNGTFAASVASGTLLSKSFLEEIKSLGENGTKRYLRPINGADTLPAAHGKSNSHHHHHHLGNHVGGVNSAFPKANQLVKSKILKRMPFAEDERTQRQHELLMEEFKVAHMKMFGAKVFAKKKQQQQQPQQNVLERDQQQEEQSSREEDEITLMHHHQQAHHTRKSMIGESLPSHQHSSSPSTGASSTATTTSSVTSGVGSRETPSTASAKQRPAMTTKSATSSHHQGKVIGGGRGGGEVVGSGVGHSTNLPTAPDLEASTTTASTNRITIKVLTTSARRE